MREATDMGEGESGGISLKLLSWLTKHTGVSQKAQDDDLKYISGSDGNLVLVARDVKHPQTREQQELRREIARDIKIEAIDQFLYGKLERDTHGKILPDRYKDNRKVLRDADVKADLILRGLRSTGPDFRDDDESREVK